MKFPSRELHTYRGYYIYGWSNVFNLNQFKFNFNVFDPHKKTIIKKILACRVVYPWIITFYLGSNHLNYLVKSIGNRFLSSNRKIIKMSGN